MSNRQLDHWQSRAAYNRNKHARRLFTKFGGPIAVAVLAYAASLRLGHQSDNTTAPDQSAIVDPLQAGRNDRLDQGYVVKSVLGQGATARALLVTKDDEEFVLKVALTEDDNLRLLAEGEALKKIQSEFVIKIYDTIEIAGKTILVLQKAGEESLATHLRKYGITLDTQ